MLHKPSIVMAALLAASCGAQAASDADLAAIRSQIDEMKRTYEQRIAALENKLAQAEADARAKPLGAGRSESGRRRPVHTGPHCHGSTDQRQRLQPRGVADPAGPVR